MVRVLTPQQIKDTCERYRNGSNSMELARDYGVSDVAIRGLLRRRGVIIRHSTAARHVLACDRHYFDAISDEPRAYWLGFLAADGCVSGVPGNYRVSVSLSVKDEGHLRQFREAIGSAHAVGHNPATMIRKYQCQPSVVFAVKSVELAGALIAQGVVPGKSAILTWPPSVPDALLHHYVRGYFDGDGCAMARPSGYPTPKLRIGFTSSLPFLAALSAYLVTTLGVAPRPIRKPFAGATFGSITITGNRQVAALYHLLYDEATVWLERKRAILRPHVEVSS